MHEMLHSETAEMQRIENLPQDQQMENLTVLMNVVLDTIRCRFGKCIFVNSGFRSKKLNDAVGGAKNSYHLSGQAADIAPGNVKDLDELQGCAELTADELMGGPIEMVELIRYKDFIHVAFSYKY